VIDLKAARQNPDAFRAALARREAAQDFDELLAADASWREYTERAESLRAEQKKASRGKPSPDELAALKDLSAKIETALQQQAVAAHRRDEILARIPNLPDPSAADGMDEEDAQVIRTVGEPPTFDFQPKGTLSSALARLDRHGTRRAAVWFAVRLPDRRRRGHRDGAVPVRADQAARQGLLTVLPPIMVGERAMYGTGFLPTEESNLYRLERTICT
jgi:seryl-tRNA synthetase